MNSNLTPGSGAPTDNSGTATDNSVPPDNNDPAASNLTPDHSAPLDVSLPTDNFNDKCRFIVNLGKASHAYGSPSMRLETFLERLCEALEIEGEFHSTPTEMVFAFRKSTDDWQHIHITKVRGGLDLNKLTLLDAISDDLHSGDIDFTEIGTRLNDVDKAVSPYGNTLTAFGYLALGAGIAGIFGGSWLDILFSSLISLVVFVMVWYGGKKGGWRNAIIPLSTAFVAGVITACVKHFVPELNYVLVTLAAIVVLIPGYSISMGVSEIVNYHVLSGLTNLTNGMVYLVKQFVGAWLAIEIVNTLWATPNVATSPVDPNWLWLLVPAIFIGLIIVFQTPRQFFGWAFLCCATGYLGVHYGSAWLGSDAGNVLGAALIGIFANVWEKKMHKPGSVVLVPAITVLVSGSIGFRGLFAAAQGNVVGASEIMQMFMIALTLTAGLVIANTVIKPNRSL